MELAGAQRHSSTARYFGGVLSLWSTLCVLLLTSNAWSAVRTEVSARRVGVGQTFTVQVTATQEEDGEEPSAPELKVSGGAQVRGPSISTQSMVRMHNFSFSSEKSVVARWQVTPTREGKLRIGPGTFQVGGQRIAGETIVVEVVPADQVPDRPQSRRRSLFGTDPLDPFGHDPFGNDPFDDFFKRQNRRTQIPEAPEEYRIDRAPDPIAFLVPRLSRTKVVVGEPVTLTILAYGARGDFGEAMPPTGPSLADFLSYRSLDNPQAEPPYQLEIGGTTYVVRKLRELVLIPLKTGVLEIGSLSTVLQNNRRSYPAKASDQGYSVRSEPVSLNVSEPPEQGRPPGYLVGDVGNYRLSAELSHKEVVQGEFAELAVRIKGQGQIPSQVLLPEQNGVVWEAPTIEGGPEIKDGELQGTRTLKYAFQLTSPGRIDLGEVSLPVFNNRSRKYEVLTAELGSIEVKEPAQQAASPQAPAIPDSRPSPPASDLSASIPLAPRLAPLPWQPAPSSAYPVWVWWGLIAAPLGIFISGSSLSFGRAFARRRSATTAGGIKTDLKEAERAMEKGDTHEALRMAERALFEALERSTGIKARGVLRHEVAKSLSNVGLSQDISERAQDLLLKLEACRYGSPNDDPQALVHEVRTLTQSLPSSKRGGRR